jgi:biopolymer transport protein ExbB
MWKKRATFWAFAIGMVAVTLLASTGSAWAEDAPRRRSIGWMFSVATFGKDYFDFISFFDMFALYACSLASIALIIEHAITIRRSILLPELSVAQVKTMFDERRFREALEFCQNDPSFVAGIIHAGLIEAANGYEAMENAMQDAASERAARLYRKIEWLNLLGNMGPMLGLWGTIWGMMCAFAEIEIRGGKANPADLAGGIMVALVSTFVGLFVAMPALASYSIFKTRIEQLSLESSLVAEELLANFKPNAA